MGRKSIADQLIESLEGDGDESIWVVCYDFKEGTSLHRFYSNRDRIISRLGGLMVQYSVYVGSHQASSALSDLARMYGAHVNRFKVEAEENNV